MELLLPAESHPATAISYPSKSLFFNSLEFGKQIGLIHSVKKIVVYVYYEL